MLTLRLTHKVIKESQLPNTSVLVLTEHGDAMEDWYVNLFIHGKRKHLLFTQIEVFHNMVAGLKSFYHIPGHRAVGLN